MDHFNYKGDDLYAEDVAISDIAKKVGTPFYCYSTATLQRHYKIFSEAFSAVDATVCFAVKANSNLAILKTLAELGSGGDCVSEGEIRRCLAAGIDPKKIVFSGVGKTKDEMKFALEQGIMQINVESEEELHALDEVARSMDLKAPIAFRVNPDVDAKTHDKIATGRKEDKFGIDITKARGLYKKAAKMDGIEIRAVAIHIGSQLVDLEPFRNAFKKLKELVKALKLDGHKITHLDLGGGLGIPYVKQNIPTPEQYANMTIQTLRDLDCKLAFEPGRLICGNAGILVAKTIYLKKGEDRNFLVVDAAMNDLLRPALYEAHHDIVPVKNNDASEKIEMDIVGPVCETGDIFAKNRKLQKLENDDLIAIRSCGAYGAVMSCEYNSRLLIPEVLVNGDKFVVIRERESYDDMLKKDKIPSW